MFGLGAIVFRVGNPYQLSRIAEGKRTQQQRIDHAEYCRSAADTEADNENRKYSGTRIATHSAKSVASDRCTRDSSQLQDQVA